VHAVWRALPSKKIRLRRARGTAPEPFLGNDRVLSAASTTAAANGSCLIAYFSRKIGTATTLACWKAGSVPIRRNDMRLSKLVAGVILGAGFLATSAMSASAAIVCSGNVCWHTHETYTYPPESRVIVHEDNWRWGPEEKFSFREHEGRGYWRDDKWVAW
jgi:hypothetical protein